VPNFPARIRQKLFGRPFGDVFPPRKPPPPLPLDGRTIALRTLAEYVAAQEFYRVMAPGEPPQVFQIAEEHIHVEWPDADEDLVTPSLAFIQTDDGVYEAIGLTAYIQEETADRYGRGTVVQWQSEYTETFQVEVRASKKAERRGIIAALETAFTPTEQMSGIRFRMPDYYDQLVCFTLESRRVSEGGDDARDRRSATLRVQMRYTVVALVHYVPMAPTAKVDTDFDADTGLPVTLGTNT
jgi:hypothetical protein